MTEIEIGTEFTTNGGRRLVVVWINKQWAVAVDAKRPTTALPDTFQISDVAYMLRKPQATG